MAQPQRVSGCASELESYLRSLQLIFWTQKPVCHDNTEWSQYALDLHVYWAYHTERDIQTVTMIDQITGCEDRKMNILSYLQNFEHFNWSIQTIYCDKNHRLNVASKSYSDLVQGNQKPRIMYKHMPIK
jgi:hypothetical protein